MKTRKGSMFSAAAGLFFLGSYAQGTSAAMKNGLSTAEDYKTEKTHSLEVAAQFNDIRPGNVAVSRDGRVFATIHPLGDPREQLVEIIKGKAVPYPSSDLQKNGKPAGGKTFDTPLGVIVDKKNRLWMIDMGLQLGRTRLYGFDLKTNKITAVIELDQKIAPKGSFIQDLAIDETRGWVYLADISNPGIIALDLSTKTARRFSGNQALQSEDVDMIVSGKVINFGGKPARVGINPITLSDDRETIFFGAMNGTKWYAVPAKLFREGADDDTIGRAIVKFGDKPVSDGAVTDKNGNHYITNLGGFGISRLDASGKLQDFISDPRLNWPDNLALSEDGYLYISVNQLYTTPAFTGGADTGRPPYFIYRIKL